MTNTQTQTITTTLGELAKAHSALTKLAAMPLPIKAAYWLSKLARLAVAEVRGYEEQRTAAVKRYGTARQATPAELANGSDKEIVEVKAGDPKIDAFLAELKELQAVEVTLPVAPINLDALPDTVEITAADLMALAPLCKVDEAA